MIFEDKNQFSMFWPKFATLLNLNVSIFNQIAQRPGGADPGRGYPSITLSAGGTDATERAGERHNAASGAVMRSGRHFAEFTLVKRASDNHFGVIQADWDVEGKKDPHKVAGHCFYATGTGKRCDPGHEHAHKSAVHDAHEEPSG